MGKYLLFSGAVPWNTRWQCLITTLTIVIALFVTVRKWFPFGAEWLAMVSIIAVGAVVADIARQEAPVHSTGAVVVTGWVGVTWCLNWTPTHDSQFPIRVHVEDTYLVRRVNITANSLTRHRTSTLKCESTRQGFQWNREGRGDRAGS